MDVKVALLTIGTELTAGLEADTNSFFISRELFNHGFAVSKHVSVPDSVDDITDTLKELIEDFDAVITTGGLGPTEDDVTRVAVTRALGRKTFIDEELLAAAKKRDLSDPEKMALFPEGAKIIRPFKRSVGGFYVSANDKIVMSLPGVPAEIEDLMHVEVLPVLTKRFGQKITCRRKLFKIANHTEVEVEKKIKAIKGSYKYGLLPKLGEVHLYITVETGLAQEAAKDISLIAEQVRKIFSRDLFAVDNESLEETTVKELVQRKMTISVAESSTGGLLGNRIASIAGASEVFLGGFITYSDDLKQEIGVPKDIIEKNGAVSEPVAASMADETQKQTKSKMSVSITGIAGPSGATKDKPVGLHYIGISQESTEPVVKKYVFRGGRDQVRWQASQMALHLIREALFDD